MFTRILFLSLALTVALAASGDPVYKWVDDQGNVHYSDKPQPGAKKITLPASVTYKAPDMGGLRPKPETPPPASTYSSFVISAPQSEITLLNVTSVTVTVSSTPPLQYGDKITLSVDGQSKGPGDSPSATFDNLDRGEHMVTATLQQANGKTLTATPVKFFIELPRAKHTI